MRTRLRTSTADKVQTRIDAATERNVRRAAADDTIDERLQELEGEWDAERVLFTASGLNALFGLALGTWVDRRWYAWAATVAAFQFQHGIQGWCPPMAVIRRLGVRTAREIEEERLALKALRGDFRGVEADPTGWTALEEARN
jgi:hypothetical protein